MSLDKYRFESDGGNRVKVYTLKEERQDEGCVCTSRSYVFSGVFETKYKSYKKRAEAYENEDI